MTDPVQPEAPPKLQPPSRNIGLWIGWILAIPSTAFLGWFLWVGLSDLPTSSDDQARAIGRVFGFVVAALVGAAILWWIGRLIFRRRQRGRFLSPWILVVAALLLVISTIGRVASLPEARTIDGYLIEADGWTYPPDTEDQAAFRQALVTASIDISEARDARIFFGESGSERLALVEVIAFEPSYIGTSDDEFWSQVEHGLVEAAGPTTREDVTVLGQAVVRVTNVSGAVGAFWHVDNLAIFVVGQDDAVNSIVTSLVRANAER